MDMEFLKVKEMYYIILIPNKSRNIDKVKFSFNQDEFED